MSYEDAILWIGARLAAGLAHAHERGIIHRDLKPANILLTDDGEPMILDFNLAEDIKLRSSATAKAGGTLPYMSPDQLTSYANPSVAVDGRSDIYSLGLILFQLLTGKFPFPMHRGRTADILPLMIKDRIGPVPELRLTIPRSPRPWKRSFSAACNPIPLCAMPVRKNYWKTSNGIRSICR